MKGLRRRKAEKAEARRRRKARHRRPDGAATHPLGGMMDPGVADQILSAFSAFDPAGPWSTISDRIVPVLKRRHHPYPAEAAPVHILVPPGVWTGFGIDFGPAFSHVNQALLDGWGVDHATLLGTALENLERLALRERPVIETIALDGIDVTAIQGQGWGSSLILAPDLLQPILGSAPRLLMTPVRNTLVALPEDVREDLAFDIWDAIAHGAQDELDVDPLRWTGSTVALLDDRRMGLPN